MANSPVPVDGPTRTFTAGAALARGTICKLSSGKLAAATSDNDLAIAVLEQASFADGDLIAARLLNSGGTFLGLASEAIVVGNRLAVTTGGALAVAAAGKLLALSAGGTGAFIEFIILPVIPDDAI
jgi:hypothetical protein